MSKNQIVNLEGQELFAQPHDVSLETNALYMGVESDRSNIFSDKEKAAQEFFSALNDFRGTDNERRAIESKFDEYMRLYSDALVFVAKLNMAKLSKLYSK